MTENPASNETLTRPKPCWPIGFEQLAALTSNPSMDNLASIFQVMRECLNVRLEAKSVAA